MPRGDSLTRQWNLLKVLQAHRFGICAEEMAERLECSKRQVQRDLNILQEVGFPIRFEERDFGKRFWLLAPQAIESREFIFSITELLSLYLSQQLLAPLAGTQFGSGLATALEKIRTFLPPKTLEYFASLDNLLLVKNTAVNDYSRHDKTIAILNRAVAECRVLDLRYQSLSRGESYDTQFHPYGMVFFSNNLYCIGYLAEYDEIRTLKVTRIEQVEMNGQSFRRPADFSLQARLASSFGIICSTAAPGCALIVIRVRLTGWAATNVREQQWHLSQKILQDNKDHLLVQYEISDTTEFKRWLLGFGRHAQVLAPKSLQNDLRRELTEAAKLYQQSQSKIFQNELV